MPTNKLWLEHTERAAWESVQALREKLADAEKRIERITPKGGGWQVAFASLDAAKQERGLPGNNYAELVQNVLERLSEAESAVLALRGELERARDASKVHWKPVPPRVEPSERRVLRDEDDDELEERPNASARFFSEVRKRYRVLLRQSGRAEVDQLLSSIEHQVDDLAELDEAELPEALVELTAHILCLDEEVRSVRTDNRDELEP